MLEPRFATISLDGLELRSATWGEGRPTVVLLHDGLGSISQWRSVPSEIASRTGRTVLAYERAGHGASLPVPADAWPADWLHQEANVLGRLLRAQEITAPIVVGHSDGGSIALLHAAAPDSDITALLALAPHSWVEQVCFDAITEMRAHTAAVVKGLSRHHDSPAELFAAWSGVWVSDQFRPWDVRPQLGTIDVPTVIAQGEDDAYASDDQAHLTAAAIGPNARSEIVAGVGHIMHHDDAEITIGLIVDFVAANSVHG